MSRDDLERQMGRMAALRGFPSGSDAYWEVLAPFPLADLERGVLRSIKTRAWFPTPSELLQDLELSKPTIEWRPPSQPDGPAEVRYVTLSCKFGSLKLKVLRDWRYDCTRCTDSGFASWWCGDDNPRRGEWSEFSQCGRREEHAAHEWVSKCACWKTNATLLRRREAMAQAAATRTAKNGRGGE